MNDRTLNPISPELLGAARSANKTAVAAMTGEGKSLADSEHFLSIDELRSAVATNDSPGLAALMKRAETVGDARLEAYSAERAWRVTMSFLREGKERQSMMMLAAMPASFFATNRGRDRDEALLLSANLHMRPASALLLENGANPAHKEHDGMTALMHFARNGDPQMLSESLRVLESQKEGLAVKAMGIKNDQGWTVGMLSVTSQASELAKKKTMDALAEYGFTFSQPQGGEGFTELHMVAGLGDISSIRHLIASHGALVDTCSTKSITPTMMAAYANQPEAIEVLASLGANVNVKRGSDGITAAHLAASLGHEESLKALHKTGANLQAQAWETMGNHATPADMAAEMGFKGAMKLIETLQPAPARAAASKLSMRLSGLLSPLNATSQTKKPARAVRLGLGL